MEMNNLTQVFKQIFEKNINIPKKVINSIDNCIRLWYYNTCPKGQQLIKRYEILERQ